MAAFGPSCNLGLSFVGVGWQGAVRGEFNGRPHLCKSAVRAGDNQGLHTITPTHLSSGGNSRIGCTQTWTPLDKQRQWWISWTIVVKHDLVTLWKLLLPDLSLTQVTMLGFSLAVSV